MSAIWHTGDTRTILRTLPDASVDLVVTSPPFLALRSYLPADHPDKAREMGSEPTPGEFLDALLDVVVELRRVLAPHGSICVELGDTYSGTGGDGVRTNHLYDTSNRYSDEWNKGNTAGKPIEGVALTGGRGWPLDKSLTMIPQTFAWSLAYGRNPWTGRTLEPWRVRNIVRWCRPNPPVGALGDKFRPATSEMTVACVARDRYFDLDAVRAPSVRTPHPYDFNVPRPVTGSRGDDGKKLAKPDWGGTTPPLDYWEIPTQPYAGAHYATFPEQLVTRPIKAMCPSKVCRTCGQPSRRIVAAECIGAAGRADHLGDDPRVLAGGSGHLGTRQVETLGWSDCGHDNWRNGIVLDCFAGSGTTGAVAVGHGRDFIGIDLDARNADLARDRIGPMFFELAEAS